MRVLAVILTTGLGLATGLVAASALSGTVEDPDVVALDQTAPDDDCPVATAAKDDAGDRCTDDGTEADADDDDDGDGDDSGAGDDSGKAAGHGEGSDADIQGASISSLAQETPAGPGHGYAVCSVASGGTCQPNHAAGEAVVDGSDEETGHTPPDHRPAKAARAGGKQKHQPRP